jgi:hypothetical protein
MKHRENLDKLTSIYFPQLELNCLAIGVIGRNNRNGFPANETKPS